MKPIKEYVSIMRRFLVVGILVTTLGTATPAQAEVVWDNQPTYQVPIPVIDVVIGTLRPSQRPIWREYRNRALRAWQIPFNVTRRAESSFSYLLDETINAVGVCPYIVPGTITLWRTRTKPPFTAGGFVEGCDGGIAQLDARLKYASPGAIGHEIGHALGLGHTLTGIMGGASRPSTDEVAAVQAMYA